MRKVGLFFWEVIVRLGLAYLVMESLLRLNPSGKILGFSFMVLVVLFFSGLNRIGDLIRETPYFKQLEIEKQFSFVFLLFVLNILVAVGLLLVSFSPEFCETHRELFSFLTSLTGVLMIELLFSCWEILQRLNLYR